MEKINTKKRKETTRDRHLKWINYYCSKNFGIWVECSVCKKWRRTDQFTESHEVPENWYCSMLTLENGEKGSCDHPEEDNDEHYLEYSPGSVVWAKLEGYPWWPAMVDEDPDVEEFSWREKGDLHYNVTFLDEKPTRAWIPEMFICPFLKPPKKEKRCVQKFRRNRYAKAISKAKERAETAMKMTIKDRLQTYSFVHLYKGHWPAASNFEECDDEENAHKNVEDMADILLKELDELGSVYSTDTDDERIEKDFSEKENKMAGKRKLISKNSDILSFKKKTYNTKYLNNKDFIPENEAVFPFMKQKKCKDSSSVKTSSNAKHQAESITNPLQGKEAKGMKRKANRKCTPRKERNFEKPSESLTDNIIDLESTDSGQKSNENSNAVSVSKEDYSKSIHVPEEGSMARDNDNGLSEIPNSETIDSEHENVSAIKEKKMNSKSVHVSKENFIARGNDNGLSEVPNYEKHKTEKQTNNVKPLDGEEVLKHIDESISKVLEFVENENLETFDECRSSDQKKIKTSNEMQKKSVKQKKSQNSLENIKQSNSKIANLEENMTQISQESPETKVLQNVSNSSSKINKQIKSGTIRQTKKSQKNIKPVNGKMNEFPKQPNSSFSIPVKDSEQKVEVIVDKYTRAVNMNKENKILKHTPQNPPKDSNPSVKVKPNFKQPSKAVKEVSQGKTKNVKKLAGTGKLKAADIKQKNSDEYEENCRKNLVKSGEDKNNSVNEKSTENLQSKKMVSVSKENVPEVISIDDEDSVPINDTMKSTENHDDNFFYVSLSDEEMDCETSKV
ncbi:Zinc finger CW-type PWWP domain protein 1 [Araneus ventricosus]|uniref:Zinc finger CW-type PWWP domain protein 1 n=1 Tax=Araneus ventricosus TaxID=182803 RepID=A0A4Y2G151_ARAVE|nr:Zinc finger CW-type PWWP domain protein 1 [Araneus ventricosus]